LRGDERGLHGVSHDPVRHPVPPWGLGDDRRMETSAFGFNVLTHPVQMDERASADPCLLRGAAEATLQHLEIVQETEVLLNRFERLQIPAHRDAGERPFDLQAVQQLLGGQADRVQPVRNIQGAQRAQTLPQGPSPPPLPGDHLDEPSGGVGRQRQLPGHVTQAAHQLLDRGTRDDCRQSGVSQAPVELQDPRYLSHHNGGPALTRRGLVKEGGGDVKLADASEGAGQPSYRAATPLGDRRGACPCRQRQRLPQASGRNARTMHPRHVTSTRARQLLTEPLDAFGQRSGKTVGSHRASMPPVRLIHV